MAAAKAIPISAAGKSVAGTTAPSVSTWSELGIPIAVLAIVIALIVPMPAALLDFLLVIDIMTSVIVLMVAMYIRRPVDFSVFPTALLLLTLYRLTLNVSATRLILMNGSTGTRAAGEMIEAFGQFVVGGNYVIGAVIFLTLIAIQYVVINHGAVRISEVTARFTLDAMPGKQMSIDSDLSAGLIDEAEARTRRKQLASEAEFYGAMDGASRFTQRDAIASILITGINIVGGLLIGVLQHGMPLRQALETYTVLTIGDGLVTVMPALMVSISGGLIVTRASSDDRLGRNFQNQIFSHAQPLLLSSSVLVVLAAIPGLPKLPFLLVGGVLAIVGWRLQRKNAVAEAAPPAPTQADTKENLEKLLKVEPLSVAFGLGLIRMVQGGPNAPLLKRLAGIRRQLATELGFLVPTIRFADDMGLRNREYVVSMKGIELSRHEMPADCDLAIPGPQKPAPIDGRPTREPAFGMPAFWISSDQAAEARAAGYTVVDPVSVVGTHLMETLRRYAHDLFSRQDTKKLLDRVAAEHPKVVEDLVPKLLPLAIVHKVFQHLLRERVSIRDAVSILEALGEAAITTRNPVLLTEYVRQAIRRAVVNPYLNASGALPALFLDPAIEDAVNAAVEHGEHHSHVNLSPQHAREIVEKIRQSIPSPDIPVVILTHSGIRCFLQQMVEPMVPNVHFLSHNEVPPVTKVVSLGVIQ